MRGRIDRRACIVRQRIDSLLHQARALARSPAALTVAFACGLLAGRLRVPDIKGAHGLLTGLASLVTTMQVISSFTTSPPVR